MNARDMAISDSIERSIKNADPEWKLLYESLAFVFLRVRKYVEGGEFKAFCLRRGLHKPDTHNRWVGMVTHLESIGWIEPLGKIEPTTVHSHIGRLTFWRSKIYDETLLEKGIDHVQTTSGN